MLKHKSPAKQARLSGFDFDLVLFSERNKFYFSVDCFEWQVSFKAHPEQLHPQEDLPFFLLLIR